MSASHVGKRLAIRMLVPTLALLFTGSTLLAQDVAADLEARVRTLIEDVRTDRDALDRSAFDIDAALEATLWNADEIIAFVTREIAYEPYSGALRGAEGTLRSRAGNALDTAVLLARLLGDSGFQTRIQYGSLNPDDAGALLAKVRARATPPEDDTPPVADSAPFAYAAAQADWLLGELDAAGIKLGAARAGKALIETATAYAWVEYRMSPSDGWQAVHPLFETAPAVTSEAFSSGSVPEDKLHTVTIEMQIEQRVGDKRSVTTVAGPYTRPAANLDGVLIEIYNAPNTVTLDRSSDAMAAALDRVSIFTPVLAGVPGTRSFDLSGNTVETDALSMDAFGAGAFFATVGDATEKAANALSALSFGTEGGDNGDLRELTGAWIVYTFTAPGGQRHTWRRALLEPLPEDLDAQARRKAMIAQLTVHHSAMVATGRFPADYAALRAYDRLIATEPLWDVFLASFEDRPVEVSPRDWPGAPDLPHLELFRLFDRAMGSLGGDLVYRNAPALIVIRSGLTLDAKVFHSVDVVANPRMALDLSGVVPAPDPAAVLRAGVWETMAERLVDPVAGDPASGTGALSVFAAAKQQGIGVAWTQKAGEVGTAPLEPSDRAALAQDLDAGFVALLPEAPPEGLAYSAWWRVDPQTGNTLGMLSDGRGSEVTEYITDLILTAYSLVKALKQYADCDQWGSTEEKACCLVEAHLNNVGGMAMGGVLGATFGGAMARMCGSIELVQDTRKMLFNPEEKKEHYDCRINPMEQDIDPSDVVGPGGIIDPTYMGCGGLTADKPK